MWQGELAWRDRSLPWGALGGPEASGGSDIFVEGWCYIAFKVQSSHSKCSRRSGSTVD